MLVKTDCEVKALKDIRDSIKELASSKHKYNQITYPGDSVRILYQGENSYRNAITIKKLINDKFSPKTFKNVAEIAKVNGGHEVVYDISYDLIKAQELVNNSKKEEITEEEVEEQNRKLLEETLESVRYDIFDKEGNVGFEIINKNGVIQHISKLTSIEDLNEFKKQRFDLKEKQYLYTSVINPKTKQPVINNDQQDLIVQQLTGIVLDIVATDLLNGKPANVFYKEGENSVLNVRKFLIKRIAELNNKYKDKTATEQEIEEFVLLTGLFKIDDFLRFQEDVINRLKAKGYKFEEGSLKISKEDESVKELQEQLVENDNEDFEMSEDITGKTDQMSDYSAFTTSNKEKMSGRLRTFLSSIKSEEPSLLTLNSDTKTYNTQYVKEDTVIQAVNESLIGINNFDKAIQNLDKDSKLYKGREFLTQVKERLLLEKEKGSEIVSQFIDKFNQQKNDLTITQYTKKPTVAYSFKNKDGVKINVSLKDKDNNVMFYYDYKVINANRNDIATNLKESAEQNFVEDNNLDEEIVPKSITKFIYDDYLEFKDYVKNNHTLNGFNNIPEAKQKIKNLFSKINVELSEDLLDELLTNKRNRLYVNFNLNVKDTNSVFHNKFGMFTHIFANLNEETTLDGIFGNSGITDLFKLEAEFQEYYYNISTLDGKGRNIWGYSMPSPFFRSLFDILNDDEKQELAGDKNKSLFTSSSYILQQLNKLNTEERKLFKENLKYSLFNTLKTRGEEGKELGEMEEQEFIISQIISLIGSDIKTSGDVYWSNKFLTTPSDKSTMYLFQTPNHKIPVSNSKVNITPDSEVTQVFYNYFQGEYRRAIAYQNGNAEYKQAVDNRMTSEPMLFYNFPQLNIKSKNNPLWKKEGDVWMLRDLNEEVSSGITVEDYVKIELSKQLKKEIERTREKLETTGVIANNTFINGFPNNYRKRVPESVSLTKDINNVKKEIYTAKEKEEKDFLLEKLKDVYDKSNALLTDYLVADYALNYLLHNVEMLTLLIGDPTQYLKNEKQKFKNNPKIFNSPNVSDFVDYIDAIRVNHSKRMAGLQGNRMEGDLSEFKTTTTVVVEDIVTPSKMLEEIQKFNPNQVDKYTNIKSMDGGGIITAEEDLRQKLIHGKIDKPTYQKMFDRVQKQHEDIKKKGKVAEENKFTPEEKLIAQPIKPMVFGNIYDPLIKDFKTTYYKDSEFALYPELTQEFEIDKLREGLYNLSQKGVHVDRLVTKTATKVGAKKPIKGLFNPDMSINENVLETITDENIDTISRSLQGIQLEVPYEPNKQEIRIASQQLKLIFNEIQNLSWSNQTGLIDKFLPELKGQKVTGKLLKTYHNNVYKELIETSLEDVLEDIGIDFDVTTGEYTFENLEKLQKTLETTAIELGYSKPTLEGLSLTPDKKEFILPISFNESSDRLEKLLLSLLNKAILQKIHGRSFILAPEMGFVPKNTFLDKLKEENKDSKDITEKGVVEGETAKKLIKQYSDSIVFTKNFDFKKGLLPSRRSNPNDKNSEILPAQVLVSWKFKDLNINDFTTTDENGRIFIDTSKVDENVLRVLGIRIPTQGHPSMSSIEIVGFLPEFMADMIVAPQDFVAMMGSDFDIDKLYGYTYNYEFTAKDGLKKITEFDEQQYRKNNAEKKLISDIFGEETTIEKEIKRNKKKVLQNKLQDIYHTIMLHPTVLDKSLEGITEGKLGELAAELKAIRQTKDVEYYSPSSVTNKINEFFENKAGKLGVGVFSVNSTFLTIAEGLGLELQKTVLEQNTDGKSVKKEVPDPFTIKVNDENFEFYKISGAKGVNKLISMFQSASVDNANLNYLYWISVNKDTMGVAALLSSLADDSITDENDVPILNEDYIVYFLSQPIIQEYIKIVNLNNKFSEFTDINEKLSSLLDSYKDRVQANLELEEVDQEESSYFLNLLKESPDYTLEELKEFVKDENSLQDSYRYLTAQYRVLNKFLALKEQADVMRSLQYLVNADSKGVPSSLAEANYKEKRKQDMLQGSPFIKNVDRVFINKKDEDVDITENQSVTKVKNLTEDNGINTLQGYIANIANDISVKIFSKNNAILASGSKHVEELVETIYKLTGRKSENYSYKFVNKLTKSYLAYLQSTSNLQIQDPNITFKEEIQNLLSSETGLANSITQFKLTQEYKTSSLLKPFFESLKIKNEGNLKFVEFKASQGLVNTDEQIVQGLNYLKKINTPLFNQLIKYALLVKIENSPVSFKKFIPIYYKEAIGLTDSLREINSKLNTVTEEDRIQATLLYLEADVLPVYAFSEQFLQHYPEETKSLAYTDFTYVDTNNKPTSDITENINIKGEFRQKYTNSTDGKEFYLPYLSVYNYEEKRYNLFKKLDNDGNYTKIPNLGQYNIDEFDSDTKTTATSILPKNQVKSLQEVKQPISKLVQKMSDFTNHSGGAEGSDIQWDIIGKEFGLVNNKHYWTETKTPYGNTEITEEDFKEGRFESAKAAKRNFGYQYSAMKDSRLIRNWSQVKHSDAIFAIGKIVNIGEKIFPNQKSDTRIATNPSVTGGTGYAVGMGINNNRPVYVFNQSKSDKYDIGWYKWDNNSNDFIKTEIPTLTKEFAGIGTREINDAGKQAIKDVYEKTKLSLTNIPSTEVENKTKQPSNPPIRELGVFLNNEEAKVNNILAGYGVTENQTGEQKVKTILNKITKDSKSPYFSELAKLLTQLDGQFGFTKNINLNLVKDQDSHYDPNNHTINLNTSQTDKFGKPLPEFSERMQYEILHELLHSVLDNRLGKETAGNILKNRINRLIGVLQSEESLQKAIELFELKDETGNLVTPQYLLNKLAILREETQDVEGTKYLNEAERSILNPLINEREFLVNVLGDNNTRMWMNEIPYEENKTLFDTIWDTIKTFFNNLIRSFGFNIKDKSALQEGLKIAFDVINYEENNLTTTEEFTEFGTIYKFTINSNGNVISGEYSQGNRNNFKSLSKPSKKYAELVDSKNSEKLIEQINKKETNVVSLPTKSGKVLQGEQIQAYEKAMSWYQKSANTENTEEAVLDNMFFLSGAGGSGKTFITEIILEDVIKNENANSIIATAPTHQAKNVLKENIQKTISSTTLQALLGLLPNPVNKSTFIGNTLEKIEELYYDGKAPFIFNYDFVVIDEASMIDGKNSLVKKEYKNVWSDVSNNYITQDFYENPDLGTYLKEVIKLKERLTRKPTKVFLMGDVAQVVPVGSGKFEISKLLTDLLKKQDNTALLTEIRRTDNQEVKKLSLAFRESFNLLFNNNNANPEFIKIINSVLPGNNITLLNNKKSVIDTFIELYNKNINSGNPIPNFTNIIWYNNSTNSKTVDQTKLIRQLLFNNDLEININENLILKNNITLKNFFGQDKDLFLGTDTKFITTNVEDSLVKVSFGKKGKIVSNVPMKTVTANVQVGSKILENVKFNIVTPSYYETISEKFKNTDRTVVVEGQTLTKQELYEFVKHLNNVEYGYIINTHKVQGSKVINPIVDLQNIVNSPEDLLHINNMIYTAISRTVNSLYIFHPQLTSVEGRPISKLTGINNANIITAEPTTKDVEISTDYFKQRLNRLYEKQTRIYADKTLTEQEKLDKLREVDVTIARIQQNVDMLENNFTLAEFFRVAQKEIADLRQILRDRENLSVEDANQAIQIFNYFDILYSSLKSQNTNFYNDNYTGEKVYVSPELMVKVEAYHKITEGLKDDLRVGSSKTFIGTYNNITGKTTTEDDFFVTEKSGFFRRDFLGTIKNKQQGVRAVSRIVTEVLRDGKQAVIDHEQDDLASIRDFEKKFSFKDFIRFVNYTDVNGLKVNKSTLISRNKLDFYNKLTQIYKNAKHEKDFKEKNKFIRKELSKISYEVDVRYLMPEEYNREMRYYYNDNNIEWINENSKNTYYDNFLNFHKEQFSNYGDDYAEYRMNEIILQARKKMDKYFSKKEIFIESLEHQKLSEQEKKDKLQDWVSYNSPFLLLNEITPLKKEDGALTNRIVESVPQEVNVKTFTTKSGKIITKRPDIDYKKRTAREYITTKAKNKDDLGNTTEFYDSEYMAMEQEYLQKENNILDFEQNGDLVSAEKEKQRTIKWEYFKFIEQRQKYYLDMLPHHLTKELKWFDLIDVEKDYQEQFSDIITPILNLDRNLVDFVKTDLLKLMSLGFNFIYDDVVKTMWDKHIAERGEYIDFITKQVKLSYNPSGLNNTLNNADLGNLRTTDVFNYFAQLRNAAINFKERNKMEELIKLGQFVNTLPMKDKHSKNKNIELTQSELGALNWTVNSKIYGAKREQIYLGTEHKVNKKVTSKASNLTKQEREKLQTLYENLEYYNSLIPTINDEKILKQITEKILLINRQIEGIKRERTWYTRFNIYSKYVSLKYLSFGIAGRFVDFGATLMGGMKQAVDGRIYGIQSYGKSLSKIMYLYSPNAISSMTTAAGVVSLNPVLALSGFGSRVAVGVINQTVRSKDVAKFNQILYRLGALDYLNYTQDDNVSSFVTKQNLSEEFIASLKTFSPFSTISQVEIINKGIPSLAVMYEEKLKDKSGKERPLIDAFTVNENLDLVWNAKEFEENEEYNWYSGNKMRSVVAKALSAQTFAGGDYDTTVAKYGQSKLSVKLVSMLRQFFWEWINSRFGSTTEEETTGLKTMGMYRAAILSIRQKTSFKKQETNEEKQIREIATRQIVFDVGYLIALNLIVKNLMHMLASMGDDDDDKEVLEELNLLEKLDFFVTKGIERLTKENLQVFNPDIIQGKIQSGLISPLFSDGMQFYKILESVYKSMYGDVYLSHAEMVSKGLAPRNKILYSYEYDDINNPGKTKTKTVYQDPITGATKRISNTGKKIPLGKYSKNYEQQSRLEYNVRRMFPFFNLILKDQRQKNEMINKSEK